MDKFKEKVQSILQKFKIREHREEREPVRDLDEYKNRLELSRKKSYIRIGIIAAAIVLGAFLIKFLVEHHKYSGYAVTETSEKLDSSVTQYLDLNGKMLRFSGDGASLASAADTAIWSDSYQMSVPAAVSFGTVAAVYDQKGTQVAVYDEDGKLGSFQTEFPIMKASVSGQGGVALILEDSDNTLINYYSAQGSLIASSSSNMRNPGYPVDLSVSEDGLYMAVSYLIPDGDTISSYLAFYNFGSAGKNKEDNLVDGFRFAGVLVPKVQYLDNDTLIAYREDGFSVYKGKQKPKETKSVTFEDEIVSSFSDGSNLGFVFANDRKNSEQPFRMEVYNDSGRRRMTADFDVVYDKIKFSGSQIIMNNATQISIFSMKGVEKFTGNIQEGNIFEVLKTGMNRYTIAYNGGVITFKLK